MSFLGGGQVPQRRLLSDDEVRIRNDPNGLGGPLEKWRCGSSLERPPKPLKGPGNIQFQVVVFFFFF